jgi:hypothetical protein
MSVAGAELLSVALAFHGAALGLLLLGARWLGRQRQAGYPDPRALAIDRRGVLIAIGAAWIWGNVVVLTVVAILSSRV